METQDKGKVFDKIVANSMPVKDLIDYRDSAVVSLTLIKKDIGTVTLFAFSAGEGLSEHSAPFDALVQGIEGSAEFVIGGNRHTLREGEIIILPAQIPHALKAVTDFKMIITMIKAIPFAQDEDE